HIWDNFSSQTYKSLEPVGVIETFDPLNPTSPFKFTAPGRGVGYYRVPSLISMWTSAPYLHNNSVGEFTGDPSVEGRLRAFNDAMEKLLWPERRAGRGSVWTTGESSVIRIPEALMPANKCPHLSEDRAHLFGANLPEADKRALIESLKTL